MLEAGTWSPLELWKLEQRLGVSRNVALVVTNVGTRFAEAPDRVGRVPSLSQLPAV